MKLFCKNKLILIMIIIATCMLTACINKQGEQIQEIDKTLVEKVQVITVYPDTKNDEVTVTVLNNSDKELNYIECIISLYDNNNNLVGKAKAVFDGILIPGNLQNIKTEVTQHYDKAEAEIKNVKAE